ncbi:MAG TPA: hypothetical protein VIY86_10160, partial [Pirellulaceae bacterium]
MTSASAWHSTVDLVNVALTLREDLRFTLQQYGDQPCYVIEDNQNSRFFRVGLPEYTFISLLDGTTTVREALAHTSSILGAHAFTEADAASICKWLVESQLAYSTASQAHDRLWEQTEKASSRKRWQRVNPLVIRLPLLHPDRWIRHVTDWLGGWFSGLGVLLWLTLGAVAIQQLFAHWSRLPTESMHLLAADNLVWLFATWSLLKIAHELSHGVACKRFGGEVREAGFMLILFAPVPYVDVTSAWRFTSKWQRIVVSIAGMYTELFLASLATLVWIHTDSLRTAQHAYNVMITASLMTVLFNANPLMRFDGYYILSDFLEIPNLSGLGQQFLWYLVRRFGMGIKVRPAQLAGWKRAFVYVYAVAALLWRILVSASILLAASVLWEGIGIGLAVGAGIAWTASPLRRLCQY